MKIWLDDQLDDVDAIEKNLPEGWVGAKTAGEFKRLIEQALTDGTPIEVISFDNDLGEPTEGVHLAEWLQNEHPEIIEKNPDIELRVHSRNIEARRKLEPKLRDLKLHYKEYIEARDRPNPFGEIMR